MPQSQLIAWSPTGNTSHARCNADASRIPVALPIGSSRDLGSPLLSEPLQTRTDSQSPFENQVSWKGLFQNSSPRNRREREGEVEGGREVSDAPQLSAAFFFQSSSGAPPTPPHPHRAEGSRRSQTSKQIARSVLADVVSLLKEIDQERMTEKVLITWVLALRRGCPS